MADISDSILEAISRQLRNELTEKLGEEASELYGEFLELLNISDYKKRKDEFSLLYFEFSEYQKKRDLLCYHLGAMTGAKALKILENTDEDENEKEYKYKK